MSDETTVAAMFETVDVGTPPPPPADYPRQLLRRGRRSARLRTLAGGLAAAATFLAAVLAVPLAVQHLDGGRAPEATGQATGRPSLPDRFARRSVFTADLEQAPPGRAVALYAYGNAELFRDARMLVVGADADTYRRLSAVEELGSSKYGFPPTLLSPDGTRVAVGSNATSRSLLLLDLRTGQRRSYTTAHAASIGLLAWSSDGRYLAYRTWQYRDAGMPADACPQTPVESAEFAGSQLAVLDLTTGKSTAYPQFAGVCRAGFGPDGRLAVQTDHTVVLLTADGAEQRRLSLPSDYDLVPRVAWSPDGTRLAASSQASEHLVFLDPTGAQATAAPPLRLPRQSAWVPVLGWRSPTSLLLQDWGGNDDGYYQAGTGRYESTIAEVPVDGSAGRVIATFSTATDCELGTQDCMVNELRLATGLLGELTVRRAGTPEHGPWPPRLVAAIVLVAGVVVLIGLQTARVVRRRAATRTRRRAARPAQAAGRAEPVGPAGPSAPAPPG